MSKKEKYSTHVLELIRNNGRSSLKREDNCHFLMFDYFDILVHEELIEERKIYTNYFSIEDTFHDDKDYKVSYKTLSLYCRTDGSNADPFFIKKDGLALSETPFLGLIQISLCQENYKRKENGEPVVIERFLENCENYILKTAQQIKGICEQGRTITRLYRSSTTGDFCLVMRTDSVEKIYNTALALNDLENPSKEYPMLTYTNVGIECMELPNHTYATLSPEFIKEHLDLFFALRFSADSGLLPMLEQYSKLSGKIRFEAAKGLFGRYDYLLHIGLEEFASIYPYLCEKKFGMTETVSCHSAESDSILEKILRYPNIKNINERILVGLKTPEELRFNESDCGENDCGENDWTQEVTRQNENLYRKIMNLIEWRRIFAEEDRSFRDLQRGMVGIYKTFSAIGMEKEAYLNWKLFYQDMEMLCNCLESCFQKYEQMSQGGLLGDAWEERFYRLRVLKDWRINILALNQYTRLVQNINYQTYQSPIYEIQTQIDTEKTMIAYRQAMMLYLDAHAKDKRFCEEGVAELVPIMYPDLSKDRVEVIAPFISQKRDNKYIKRAIICTVPSFEYFGRLYDLLPWLFHEASHHLRILKREERNQFVAKYVFSCVYAYSLRSFLGELANDHLHQEIGRVEQQLIDCMVEVSSKELYEKKAEMKAHFSQLTFDALISEIDNYLQELYYEFLNKDMDSWYKTEGIRDSIFEFYLSEYRKGGLLKEENLNKILKLKQDIIVGGEETAQAEGDILAEGLLCYYRERLSAPEYTDNWIQLKDLNGTLEWLEKKLVAVDRDLLEKGLEKEAVKEYHFDVTELYRIVRAYKAIGLGKTFNEERLNEYLKKVFKQWCKKSTQKNLDEEFLRTPKATHVLRNLGLLDGEQKKFCVQMQNVFSKQDYNKIYRCREMQIVIYRETFADLMMATSLNMNSFGYIRQVLQTISDARTEENGSRYDNVNISRFKIVLAILLEEESKCIKERAPKINRIQLGCGEMFEKGVEYCEYTLKCISDKLMATEEIKKSEKKREIIEYLLGDIRNQLEDFLLKKGGDKKYRSTYLYCILHGKKGADKDIASLWEEYGYDEILKACESVKYIFLRLEAFCLGLKNIFLNGTVTVPLDVFEHMKKIRNLAKGEKGEGCSWENEWECLAEIKRDVGEFYNNPKLVYEKKSSQKLENTIDFIQNYYYYNRFKMAEEKTGD